MDALNRVIAAIEDGKKSRDRVVVAIDGKSGTGKSHLARLVSQCIDCSIIHVDDFFLPSSKRTRERLEMPGGNVDSERLLEEVMIPLSHRKPFCYRPYDCGKDSIEEREIAVDKDVVIVEGVYSLLPAFRKFYDMGFILDAPYRRRLDRIWVRSGEEQMVKFVNVWIPLEDRYFDFYDFGGYEIIENS